MYGSFKYPVAAGDPHADDGYRPADSNGQARFPHHRTRRTVVGRTGCRGAQCTLLGGGYAIDLNGDNASNQAQPLLLSNHGWYVWSEQPFAFAFAGNTLTLTHTHDRMQQGRAGTTLRDAYLFASRMFFPPTGQMPDSLLFSQPQWNTWIELTYNQNQADVLRYAHAILDNGFQPGVLMINDTWQEDYGVWTFHPGWFTNPKAMVDELHRLGFKVMLWVCPFVSADSKPYRELRAKKTLLIDNRDGTARTWSEAKGQPAVVRWWNEASAVLDFTNPTAVAWFNAQLDHLHTAYGIDGYKFDAGDAPYYPATALARETVLPTGQTERFAQFGLRYPLNEYRAMWKMADQPLAQRLRDKEHNWDDLQKLVPEVVAQGLMGYAFT